MTKFFSILFAVLGFVVGSARAESPIDFSTSDNLKAVYDAGFRPWRTTMDSCTVTDKNISVILPGNAQFSLPSEIATFSVLAENRLSSADFIGQVMSTDDAIAKVREICSAVEMPVNGLDQAIPTFAERASKPSIWNTRGKRGEISVSITLDRLDFIDHLGAKVYVTLQWKRNGVPMKFLTSPVQPPPGYENASMVHPPTSNNPNPHQPYHSPEEYKAMIAKRNAGDTNSAPAVPTPSLAPVAPTQQTQPASESGIPWWIYVILTLSVGLIAGLWYRSRPK